MVLPSVCTATSSAVTVIPPPKSTVAFPSSLNDGSSAPATANMVRSSSRSTQHDAARWRSQLRDARLRPRVFFERLTWESPRATKATTEAGRFDDRRQSFNRKQSWRKCAARKLANELNPAERRVVA